MYGSTVTGPCTYNQYILTVECFSIKRYLIPENDRVLEYEFQQLLI